MTEDRDRLTYKLLWENVSTRLQESFIIFHLKCLWEDLVVTCWYVKWRTMHVHHNHLCNSRTASVFWTWKKNPKKVDLILFSAKNVAMIRLAVWITDERTELGALIFVDVHVFFSSSNK